MPGRWVSALLLSMSLSIAVFTRAFAQSEPLPLFAADSTLSITIEGPIRRLYRERHERPDLEGVVRYVEDDGTEVVLDVELTARGNTRLELCGFPPVWLNFRRSQLDGTVFEGQNRLKLVTLCRDADTYRDYLAQEYQIYRAYNAITDYSFRVRWLEVEYVDTEARRRSTQIAPAFLIEEDWEVAERDGLEAITVESIGADQLDPAGAALLSVFQFLIGSTDWSPIMAVPGDNCCHNTKLIGPDDSESGRIVLPYDFDQVGLINASFAEPSPTLPIRRVTDRLFRGYCIHNDYVPAAVERLIEKRSAVEAAFELPEVGARQRNHLRDFLADSYEILSDPERLQDELLDHCRGPAAPDGNIAGAG